MNGMSTRLPPTLVDPRLASAMTHPTRLSALRILSERQASPKEIADQIGEPLNNVAYHIKVLRELGCIELVDVKQARGGRVAEHLYRGTQRPYFDSESWNLLDDAGKLNVVSAILHHVSEDMASAMVHGTFYEDDDSHLSRTPLQLDDEGWTEVVDLLQNTLDGLLGIKEEVAKRGSKASERSDVRVAILQFRMPPNAP